MAMPKREPTVVVRVPVALKDELTTILDKRKELIRSCNNDGARLESKLSFTATPVFADNTRGATVTV